MQLGAFSVSLSVKDLEKSKAFYETLGFGVFAGSLENHYLIMTVKILKANGMSFLEYANFRIH